MLLKRVVFGIVLLLAVAAFAWSMRRFGRMILAGKPEQRFDRVGDRLRSVLEYFFGQKKVVEQVEIPSRRAPGLVTAIGSRYHFFIFWGFILITVGTAEVVVQGVFPSFSWSLLLGHGAASVLDTTIDWTTLIVLLLMVFAVVRRMVLAPRLIPMSRDAALILGGISTLMVTHFGTHAFAAVAGGVQHPDRPVSATIGGWMMGMDRGLAAALSDVNWWIHVGVILTFLNYLIYSKHSHILAALPNIYFRQLGQRGVLPKLNLEADDMAATGIVSEYKDFTWKSLLDSFACTECARCTNYCPAYNTGKPLSPMHVVHDVRDDLKAKLPDRGLLDSLIERMQHGEEAARREADPSIPLVGGRTTEEVLWACTTCGACQEVCPVFIDQPRLILEMRRNLVLLQEKVPSDLARTFKNLEQNGNPWGLSAEKRMDWAAGKDVPTLEEKPEAEYLLWVGCAGAYDDRVKKQTLALVEILQAGGVDFAVLGIEEGCTGDPARRSGNEMLYQMQAQQNVETLNSRKVRKIITACPHCLHTIRNEYPQLGGNFEVIHHTQMIRTLVESGKVEVRKGEDGIGRVVFHDPCYLGRWNGEYEAPRQNLDAVAPDRVEPHRTREHGFCCGAGGGRMWMEEKTGTRVNHNRVDELIATGARTIATACPFCTIMVRDGVSDRGAEERVQVLNVSEVIARSLVRKRELTESDSQSPG
jgi:Fe-S oxidoreductase